LATSAAGAVAMLLGSSTARAQSVNVSAPAILEFYESTYQNEMYRMPDVFAAGYGGVWLPPTSTADTGSNSVGYDVYDRFNLGTPSQPTQYGTLTGLESAVKQFHAAGANVYTDLEWNDNGFDQWSTSGFAAAGGYPGFVLSSTSNPSGVSSNDMWGDFHNPSETSTWELQVAGLIDIAQESNNMYVRSPVPGNPNDIPAGTTAYNGRLANVPSNANYAFYPDDNGTFTTVQDPTLGLSNVPEYYFNTSNPMAGTPTEENAMGYLMRQAQYMIQVVGVDGFRVDAAYNMPQWVMNYLDLATYDRSTRTLLSGQQEQIFSFLEVETGDFGTLQSYISKTALSNPAGTVGGNRDVLDFPLYWAMAANLTSNGEANNWNNMINASIDENDDGYANNGSQGVSFVCNQDGGEPPPALVDVAYAFTLMRPGNTIVYYNAGEFGDRSFPGPGSPSSLGGDVGDTDTTGNRTYVGNGNAVSTLVNLRNEYGRGNFQFDYTMVNQLAYERNGSCLVLLDNRCDSGYDQATFNTGFPQGAILEELTGNAANATDNPGGIAPQVLVVGANGQVTVDFLRNGEPGTSTFTDAGYLIYGYANPQGTLSLSNTVATGKPFNLANPTETASNYGTTLVSTVPVVTSSSFTVTLNTVPVSLLGLAQYRDHDADGSMALINFDGGVNVTGSGLGTVSGSTTYGFGTFTGTNSPGYYNASGYGTYSSSISTTNLSQGYHYIDVRAFRYQDTNEQQVFTDFKQSIYVDTMPPDSSISALVNTSGNNFQVTVESVDQTANSVHTFLNLAPDITNAQVLAMAESGSLASSSTATQTDVNLFQSPTYNNVPNGNNVVTIVSFKPDGNSSVERFTGVKFPSTYGKGLGDLNHNDQFDVADVYTFWSILTSEGAQFNPAADINGDGKVDDQDLFMLPQIYASNKTVQALAESFIQERGDVDGAAGLTNGKLNDLDIQDIIDHFGETGAAGWEYNVSSSGVVGEADVITEVRTIMHDQIGDADLNGRVDLTDLKIVAADWGMTDATYAQGAFTGDGTVGPADLALVAQNYGWRTGDSEATPTALDPTSGIGISITEAAQLAGIPGSELPEPGTISLLALPATGLLRRRRRPTRIKN
jgi:alpha-amylase